MKVKELIEKLQKLDPELDVIIDVLSRKTKIKFVGVDPERIRYKMDITEVVLSDNKFYGID